MRTWGDTDDMAIGLRGENLVFLISQPRAGCLPGTVLVVLRSNSDRWFFVSRKFDFIHQNYCCGVIEDSMHRWLHHNREGEKWIYLIESIIDSWYLAS